nr:acyltransferase [Hyphomonas sp. Mor2]
MRPVTVAPQQRFEALDTLRGIAALTVAVWHFRPEGLHFNGFLAVDFFLILSGFVLTHAYFNREDFSLGRFAWLRWARMYPLHLATLAMMVALDLYTTGEIDRGALILHGLMIHEIGLGPGYLPFNTPSWTISVEFWINIGIAALVVWLAPKARMSVLVLLMVFCFAIVATQAGSLDLSTGMLWPGLKAGLVRCTGEFILGIFIYKLYQRHPSAWLPFGGGLALLVFILALATPWLAGQMQFVMVPVFAGIVYLFAQQRGSVNDWLAKGRYLGKISFSVYMVHWPVLMYARTLHEAVFDQPMEMSWAVIAGLLALTIGLAHLVCHWVELPIYHFLRDLGRRKNAPAH